MSVASPRDAQARPYDGPQRPPLITRYWPRGKTLTRDEALHLVADVYRHWIEGHDDKKWMDEATVTARLTGLVNAGWFIPSDWSPEQRNYLSYTRAEVDPPLPGTVEQPPPRTKWHQWPSTRVRYAEVIDANGERVRIPVGVEEVPGGTFDQITGEPVRHDGPTPTF